MDQQEDEAHAAMLALSVTDPAVGHTDVLQEPAWRAEVSATIL